MIKLILEINSFDYLGFNDNENAVYLNIRQLPTY